MKRTASLFVAIVFSLVCCAYADYAVTDSGTWPRSWSAELEPLRKQARTFQGPKQLLQHYAIPFTKRDEFESAWPHLLKIKSRGAPIVLRRGPSFWLGDKATAGVCVHTPPAGEAPIAAGKDAKGNWEKTIYIELIVDGEIIDLNRIPLPADTPIIDLGLPKIVPEKQTQQAASAEDWGYPKQSPGVSGHSDINKLSVADYWSRDIDDSFTNVVTWYAKRLNATALTDAIEVFAKRPVEASDTSHGSATSHQLSEQPPTCTTTMTYFLTPQHKHVTILHPVSNGDIVVLSIAGTELRTSVQFARTKAKPNVGT